MGTCKRFLLWPYIQQSQQRISCVGPRAFTVLTMAYSGGSRRWNLPEKSCLASHKFVFPGFSVSETHVMFLLFVHSPSVFFFAPNGTVDRVHTSMTARLHNTTNRCAYEGLRPRRARSWHHTY